MSTYKISQLFEESSMYFIVDIICFVLFDTFISPIIYQLHSFLVWNYVTYFIFRLLLHYNRGRKL